MGKTESGRHRRRGGGGGGGSDGGWRNDTELTALSCAKPLKSSATQQLWRVWQASREERKTTQRNTQRRVFLLALAALKLSQILHFAWSWNWIMRLLMHFLLLIKRSGFSSQKNIFWASPPSSPRDSAQRCWLLRWETLRPPPPSWFITTGQWSCYLPNRSCHCLQMRNHNSHIPTQMHNLQLCYVL